MRLQKRRSTAALHNVTAVPRAQFSLASWSAAVFRRFWMVGSLVRDISPTDPQLYWNTRRFEVKDLVKRMSQCAWLQIFLRHLTSAIRGGFHGRDQAFRRAKFFHFRQSRRSGAARRDHHLDQFLG